MSGEPCADMHLLIQADLDGELSAADAARVLDHVRRCPSCAAMRARLMALSTRLRAEAPRYHAPPTVHRRPRQAVPYAAGLALAACIALLAVLPRGESWPDDVVAAHIRALQPGHLIDVVSTDRHTVKPWFDGKLPFAPPVKELVDAGFPLRGGRLDYLPNHIAATLIYGRRLHVIDLFIWPGAAPPANGAREGYNYRAWQQDGMAFWAVSDLNADELGDFVKAWKQGQGALPPGPPLGPEAPDPHP